MPRLLDQVEGRGHQHQVLIDVDLISRSRLDKSAAIHSVMRSTDSATNRRDTADLDTARRVHAAASQWQQRLPGRVFRVIEGPGGVVVLRIA